MHTLGHFDIYGCLFAIGLLLIPARSIAYVLLAAAFSAVLVLIHHIHVLMYVPTIAAIVVLRHYLVQRVTPAGIAVGGASLAMVGALFIVAQFRGTLAVPPQAFVDYLQSRMADPSRTDLLSFAFIWYQPLAKEIADTWARLPHNILGIPVFALLIWLHTPLWRYFAGLIRALADEAHRKIVIVRARDHYRRLSHHVRHRVRLFAMGVELGGLHVPDAACGEDAAGCPRNPARSRRTIRRRPSSARSSR